MKKVEIGWDENAPMLHNVDIQLEIGMRLVILGPNGAGKSTLMRAMAGRGGILSGSRVIGDGVEIGVFTQDLAQDLPGHLSALNFVLQVCLLLFDFVLELLIYGLFENFLKNLFYSLAAMNEVFWAYVIFMICFMRHSAVNERW